VKRDAESNRLKAHRSTAGALCLAAIALLVGAACVSASAQAPAGVATGSLTRWPPYVYDTETLNQGRIVFSTVGGVSHTGGTLRNTSLYSGLEIGVTDRLLVAVAGSTSFSNKAATKFDDFALHLRYRFASQSRGRPAFAIAGNIQRQAFLRGTGISPYEGQLMIISESRLRWFTIYGQAGYTTRNQPFEGLGLRKGIGDRLILTTNYSYKHARLFSQSTPVPTPGRPTSTVAYVTAYYSVSDRVGLTAAIGRTFPGRSDSGGFTRFVSFGIGFALSRGRPETPQKSEAGQAGPAGSGEANHAGMPGPQPEKYEE
jgi:hypothetical protein